MRGCRKKERGGEGRKENANKRRSARVEKEGYGRCEGGGAVGGMKEARTGNGVRGVEKDWREKNR